MTPDRIKELRSILGITQEELAVILGVTKTTIGRYEIGAAKPVGDAEKKLVQLDAALVDLKQRGFVHDMLKGAGGTAALAGSLAVGSAILPMSAMLAGGLGLAALLAGPAGKTLFGALKKLHGDDENGKG